MMPCLPAHGRVACTLCHQAPVHFDETLTEGDNWRIRANPLSWGSQTPEVLVLGFSKGPTQAGALATSPHDKIACKGARKQAYRILSHVGVVPPSADPGKAMDRLIADRFGRLAFGSLVRCTVERFDRKTEEWTGTGGDMLGAFMASSFGRAVAGQCAGAFLGRMPARTRLVVLYGMGTKLNYVDAAERLIGQARSAPGWRRHDAVSYGDDETTFVHVEHFRSQGRLIPDWVGEPNESGRPRNPERARLGVMARAAVGRALGER
jgi:hypothetical protein